MKNLHTFNQFLNESTDWTNKMRIKALNQSIAHDGYLRKRDGKAGNRHDNETSIINNLTKLK